MMTEQERARIHELLDEVCAIVRNHGHACIFAAGIPVGDEAVDIDWMTADGNCLDCFRVADVLVDWMTKLGEDISNFGVHASIIEDISAEPFDPFAEECKEAGRLGPVRNWVADRFVAASLWFAAKASLLMARYED
jgi:hypothetical protein